DSCQTSSAQTGTHRQLPHQTQLLPAPFMNIDSIDSRYPVRHKLLLAGSGERAAVTLTRVAGYRRSPRGRQRRPIIRSNSHAPDQTILRSQLLQREFDLAAPDRSDLTSE